MHNNTPISQFRAVSLRNCNGLVVVHFLHRSGNGKTKRRFNTHAEAFKFLGAHKIVLEESA